MSFPASVFSARTASANSRSMNENFGECTEPRDVETTTMRIPVSLRKLPRVLATSKLRCPDQHGVDSLCIARKSMPESGRIQSHPPLMKPSRLVATERLNVNILGRILSPKREE